MADRYQIHGKLARGGIGAIYKAFDTVMGRNVAIKRLLPLEETHLNEAADDSLKREAAALARFQHSNVVTIYAFEEDADGPFVVMELVEGENLKATIERGALPVDDFEELVLQVLDPLVAAQELNLLHRDIKPSNIMLSWLPTGRFQLKVLDFGLAKFSHQPSTQTLDQKGSFLGSIDYLAPEQLELEPLDQRTDLYSLGCVLYFCLTQRPPFEGDSAAKTMTNHLKHEVTDLSEIRPDVPGAIAAWVMRLISRYPKQRPGNAREALKEFQAARSGVVPGAAAAEEENIPVAKLVEDPPPAPTEKTGRQLLLPASDSQPIRRPVAGASQPIRPHTRPQTPAPGRAGTAPQARAGSGTGPQAVAAATSGGDPKSPLLSPEKIEWIKNPYVQLGGASLLLILVLVFALGDKSPPGDSGDDTPASASTPGSKPETSSASGSDPAPPSLPKLENPTALPRVSPPPAIAEGLTMHYAASDWVLGSDFKTPAKSGERVKAWGNIAAGIEKDHLLIVDRNAQDLGPIFTLLDPADYPELKAKTPALEFSRGGSKLNVSGGGQDWKPRLEKTTAMTFMAVLRTTSPRGNIFRFERKSGSAGGSWAFSFEIGSKGYYTTLNKGSLQPRCETPLGNTRKNFLIFTTVWDGGQVHQRHYARLPNGQRLHGPIEDAPFKPIEPSRYSLGNSPNPDPRASYTEGHFLEWMVYDRALPEAEIETLEKQLSEKYFTPGFDQKPNVPFYNSEGKLPDPRNPADAKPSTPAPPVTDGLSARYAAGDFTLGNDCVTPVSPGKGCVVVWGNAAADASGDHLMAWGSGREGRAPMMISARPNQYPELASPKDAVRFMTGSELVSRGGQFRGQGNDDGFTAFIVFNGEPESGPALRLSTDTIEDFATIGPVKDGFEAVMRDGPDDRQSVKCFGQPGAFAIASLTWRGDQRTQEFFVRQKDGATVTSKRGNAPAAPRDLSRYQISRVPDPKYKDLEGFYNGRVLEFLIYTRALSDDERKAVEDHLHGQYFAK